MRLLRPLGLALLIAAGAVVARPAWADTASAAFARGNESYLRGDYPAAITAYEQVVALGLVHEVLYYNLGNAYYRAGRLGAAIYNFERAYQLAPEQEDVRYNLEAARAAAARAARDRLEGAEEEPAWQRLAGRFTVAQATWGFFGLYGLCFAVLLMLRFIRPGLGRTGVQVANAFVAVGALASAVLLGARIFLAEGVRQAVVLPDAVEVKEGPDPNYRTAFQVHAGLKVRLLEQDQEWSKVRLANGLDGWLRDADLGAL